MPATLPNGWYKNREGQVAWWDGSRWTLRTSDTQPHLPPSPTLHADAGSPVLEGKVPRSTVQRVAPLGVASPPTSADRDLTRGARRSLARRPPRRKAVFFTVGVVVLLAVGGVAFGFHLQQRAELDRAAQAVVAAQASMDALQAVITSGEALSASGVASLDASSGKVNEELATKLSSALEELDAAITVGEANAITDASALVVDAQSAVDDAVVAYDVEQERLAAEAAMKVTVEGSISTSGFFLEDSSASTLVANEDDGTCVMLGGYSDISSGASVTVYDALGAIVGSSNLSTGRTTRLDHQDLGGYVAICAFDFSLTVSPSDFFQVEVSHRGKVTVAREDASSIVLSLG